VGLARFIAITAEYFETLKCPMNSDFYAPATQNFNSGILLFFMTTV